MIYFKTAGRKANLLRWFVIPISRYVSKTGTGRGTCAHSKEKRPAALEAMKKLLLTRERPGFH